MAATTIPKVLVYQEYTIIPTAVTQPMRACVVGPLAQLCRYAIAAEKALIGVGDYDPLSDHDYSWPGRLTGAKVDLGSPRLFVDDARLVYYRHVVGDGVTVTIPSGKKDRLLISGSRGFKANGPSHPMLDDLGDRGVQVGDDVLVSIVDNLSNRVDIQARVKSVLATKTAAVVGAATAAVGNGTTAGSASAVVTRTSGTANSITLAAILTNYSSWTDGYLNDVYTVEVIAGSVAGDLSTARLRITTASGQDDVVNATPGLIDHGFAVGRRGLILKFWSNLGSSSTALDDLHYGDKWTISVADKYTAVTATSGGSFTGDDDDVYVVECVRGGVYADAANRPKIVCSTSMGVDLSGPTTITAANTAFAVGSRGVTAAFSGTGMRKGDRWYVPVTAAQDGAFNVLQLNRNLPDSVLAATDCDLDLAIKKNVEVVRTRQSGDDNWTADAAGLTTLAEMTAVDDSYTVGGQTTALPIKSGKLFIEYRAWRSDKLNHVLTVSDPGALDDVIPGPLDPANPLKWGVYLAQINAGGAGVCAAAVADPDDLDAWASTLGVLAGREGFHGLVPLSTNKAVLDLFVAHVNARSSPERGQWRTVWVPLTMNSVLPIATAAKTTNGLEVMATITAGSGGNLVVSVPASNIDLERAGVLPGDQLRCRFGMAGAGSYETYVVDEVANGNSLRLVSGPPSPVTLPSKVEIWHPLTVDEQADDLVRQARGYGSMRVRAVWPDRFDIGGTTVSAEFVACLPAGLRSGVAPHQGLTNVELSGPDEMTRSLGYFSQEQLERMALGGVWVLYQSTDGAITTLMATTTAIDSLNTREEMVVANVDSISYFLRDRMRPFVGRANATDGMVDIISVELGSALSYLASSTDTPSLGGQVGHHAAVVECRRHAILRDRIVAVINPDIPYPLNNPEVHLVI